MSHALRCSPLPSHQDARLAQPLTRMGVSHPPLPGWESRFASSPASPQTEPSPSWLPPRGRRIADPGNAAHVGPSGCTACAGRKAGWSLCPLFAKRTGVGTWPGRGKNKEPRKGSVLLAQYRAKRFRIAQAIRNPLRQRGCEGLGPFRSNFAFAGAKEAGTPYSQYFFEILGMKSGRVAGGSGKGLNRFFCTLRSCHFFGESGFEKRMKKKNVSRLRIAQAIRGEKVPYCTGNTVPPASAGM